MRDRAIGGGILAILILPIIWLGDPFFSVLIFVILALGISEFSQLVARDGHRASGGLMFLWLIFFTLNRHFPDLFLLEPGIGLLMLSSMFWSMVRFRQGTANAYTGFAMTMVGAFYIAWAGSHFILLRGLHEGVYWTYIMVLSVVFTDTGAYLVGWKFGKTPFVPDISPKKTWEGYLGGVLISVLGTYGMAMLCISLGAETVKPIFGIFIGLINSTISPLGDLAISMIKRSVQAKNASNLIPGHGGILDRLDSMLVALILSYYLITLVFLR